MIDNYFLKKAKKENFLIETIEMLRIVVFVLLILYLVPTFIVRPEKVVGKSMYPTLQDGDRGLSNIFASLAFGVKRFEIVAVVEPESGNQWVKRVIGLPNETVEYKDGSLYINGIYQEEPFLDEEYMQTIGLNKETFTDDFPKITLKDDEYFLVGDNRPYSQDSRARGPFHRSDIIGKHFYIYWPFQNIGVKTNGK